MNLMKTDQALPPRRRAMMALFGAVTLQVVLAGSSAWGHNIGLSWTKKYTQNTLADNITLQSYPEGDVIDAKRGGITIYNSAPYTVNDVRGKTVCTNDEKMAQWKEDMAEHQGKKPSSPDPQELQAWMVENAQISARLAFVAPRETAHTRDTDLRSFGAYHYATWTFIEGAKQHGWVCETSLRINAKSGNKKWFDVSDSDWCELDLGGVAWDVKADGCCDCSHQITVD